MLLVNIIILSELKSEKEMNRNSSRCSNSSSSGGDKNDDDVLEGEEPGAIYDGSIVVQSKPFNDITTFLQPPIDGDKADTGSVVSDDVLTDDEKNGGVSPEPMVNEVAEFDEDWRSASWKKQKKHVFIMSYAGKPIYTRYGDEDQQAALMGVLQTLVMYFSHMAEPKDTLLCTCAGGHKFVFLGRDPLILVLASHTDASPNQLTMELMYVYYQIISTLTAKRIRNIFEKHKNYDLRRMLSGAERQINSLLDATEHDPCFFLGAVRCLPLELSVRDTIAQAMAQFSKVKDLVFSILIAHNQLVMYIRLKNYVLHPIEIHLILNLLVASESLKTSETWTPICLPLFEPNGFVYAHISYLDETCNICLLMITVNENLFHTLSNCRRLIAEKLTHFGCLKAIQGSAKENKSQYKASDVGIPEIHHFLYKTKSASLLTSPMYEAPYSSQSEQDRLLSLYQYVHQRLHNSRLPVRLLFHVGKSEALLGRVTSGFELYIAFTPFVSKGAAVNAMDKLLRWIKKEEDRLFIRNSPTI